jgi:predicted nucleic acid-binding protein
VSVVIDASALVAFVTNEEVAETVGGLLREWSAEDTSLHAPILARYEIANAFTKKVANGTLNDEGLEEAWKVIEELPISYHGLHDAVEIARIALKLERRSAYDAAYLLAPDKWLNQNGRARCRARPFRANGFLL